MVRYFLPMGIAAACVLLVTVLLPRHPWNDPLPARLDSPRVLDRGDPPVPRAQVMVGLAPDRSPRTSYSSWERFAEYLGRRLSLSVGLDPRDTNKEVESLLLQGSVDFALVGSGTYVRARRKGAVEPIAVPKARGSTSSQGLLVVRKDSPCQSLGDLKGRSLACSSAESTHGSLMPLYAIFLMGEDPERFFASTLYTHSQGRSITSVAYGFVDGAAVSSRALAEAVERTPEVAASLRVIARSAEFGASPIVASERASTHLRERVREVLLAMEEDDEGREVLKALRYDSFEPVSPEAYRVIEEMQDALKR